MSLLHTLKAFHVLTHDEETPMVVVARDMGEALGAIAGYRVRSICEVGLARFPWKYEITDDRQVPTRGKPVEV